MNIDKGIKSSALTVLKAEAKVIRMLTSMVDGQFVDAVTTVLDCSGRLVVIGVGKSGHIAGKIASTLASTGTPAFFVNAAEASHGANVHGQDEDGVACRGAEGVPSVSRKFIGGASGVAR